MCAGAECFFQCRRAPLASSRSFPRHSFPLTFCTTQSADGAMSSCAFASTARSDCPRVGATCTCPAPPALFERAIPVCAGYPPSAAPPPPSPPHLPPRCRDRRGVRSRDMRVVTACNGVRCVSSSSIPAYAHARVPARPHACTQTWRVCRASLCTASTPSSTPYRACRRCCAPPRRACCAALGAAAWRTSWATRAASARWSCGAWEPKSSRTASDTSRLCAPRTWTLYCAREWVRPFFFEECYQC